MMTRDDVTKDYTLSAHGIVQNPGKFEGEHWSTVVMYDLAMNGGADDTWRWADDECEDVFILDDELRAALADRPHHVDRTEYAFTLYNDSQGFVYGETIDRATFDGRAAEYEKQYEEMSDEQ
jgi:hypothetical protein